jgi:hypothetical protein
MFFKTYEEAQRALVDLCSSVRKEGLYLNESKTKILKTDELHYKETEIDQLFEQAKSELDAWEIDYSDYGFEPFLIECSDEDLETKAIEALYDMRNSSGNDLVDRIDKFCLPLFAKSKSEYAIDASLDGFINKPHLTNYYTQYLNVFFDSIKRVSYVTQKAFLDDKLLYDSQKMWALSMFYNGNSVSMDIVHKSCEVLEDLRVNIAVRALCALVISKHGDGSSRRIIRNHYADEPSSYVKEAILYSAKFFPSPEEKSTCIKNWGNHSDISKLISTAMKNESKQNVKS